MLQVIHNLLDPATLKLVQNDLATARFEDGSKTAFGMARNVKNNLQLDNEAHPHLVERIQNAILEHAEFQRLAMPWRISKLRVARYETGMDYGYHSDAAMMDGARSDISFTLFLSDPASYVGGELSMATAVGDIMIKLPAGSLVLYGTSRIHRVLPVQSGKREAAVGWIQSLIRDDEQREMVADLELLRRDYLARVGHDGFAELLLKCSNNLKRMWIET